MSNSALHFCINTTVSVPFVFCEKIFMSVAFAFCKMFAIVALFNGFLHKADPFRAFFFFFTEWVSNHPVTFLQRLWFVTPFYSSTMVMTVIVSKITQFLHFLNVMSSQHTVSGLCHSEPTLYITFDLLILFTVFQHVLLPWSVT